MAIEQILPFGAGHDFFDRMGGRVLPNGHSVLGTQLQHPLRLRAGARVRGGDARGARRRARAEILQRSPQNALCYPSLALKGSPQAIRVIRPLAADRTVVEAWSFRVEGAPELLLERSVTYNRLVFSPMSVVAHDDVHLFQGIQKSLRADGNEWVSLHRGFDAGELRHADARRQRHQRDADAQPVPRLGPLHDARHGRVTPAASAALSFLPSFLLACFFRLPILRRPPMKNFLRSALGVVAGCALSANVLAADLKVGLSVSLSGPNASLGVPYAKGMQAAVAYRPEIAGRKVVLTVLDDASDPTDRRPQRAEADRGRQGRHDHGHLGRAGGDRDGAGAPRDQDADDRPDADRR